MALGTPPRDESSAPVHLGVMLAHTWLEDDLLLVVSRDQDLDGDGGTPDLLQLDASDGAGAHRVGEWHSGDAQTSDEGRADKVGIRPGVQEDPDLELGPSPGDSGGDAQVRRSRGRRIDHAHQDPLTH